MKILKAKDGIQIFLISLLTYSCGYELRTNSRLLSDQTIQLDASSSEMNELLEDLLLSENNRLISTDSQSDITLKIVNHSLEQFVGSIGYGARTTQVRLDYNLEYKIIKNKKNISSHDYQDSTFIDFNQSDLLSFNNEVNMAKQIFISKGLKNIEFILSSRFSATK